MRTNGVNTITTLELYLLLLFLFLKALSPLIKKKGAERDQRSQKITYRLAGFIHDLLGSSFFSATCYMCDFGHFTSSLCASLP